MKCGKLTDRETDGWMYDRQSEMLIWAFRSGELKAFSSGELKQINNGRGSQHYNSWYKSNQCALYWTDEHIIKIIYSDQYLRVEKTFNEIMHFHYMTYMATPYHKNPCPGGNEMPLFTLLYTQCVWSMPIVEEKILKEIPSMFINFTF